MRLNAALCEVCAAPQVDELGAFLHLTFLLPRAFLYALEVRQRRAAEDTENEKKTRTTSKQATGRWPLVLCGFGWPCPSLGPKQEFKQLGKATGPHCAYQQTWKTQLWPQDWKRSVFIPISKKGNAKECSIALILHASKSNAQNSPTKASTVHEPRISRCSRWI